MAGKLRLTAFDNPEKTNHTDARSGGLLPSFPSRHGLFGRPGVGKGSVTQNLLGRGRGDFDTFTVVHWDKDAPEWVELRLERCPVLWNFTSRGLDRTQRQRLKEEHRLLPRLSCPFTAGTLDGPSLVPKSTQHNTCNRTLCEG